MRHGQDCTAARRALVREDTKKKQHYKTIVHFKRYLRETNSKKAHSGTKPTLHTQTQGGGSSCPRAKGYKHSPVILQKLL